VLHIMETPQAGFLRKFSDSWFAAINDHNKMPRVYGRKLSIMALCALLEMAPGAVPECLNYGWPGIVSPHALARRVSSTTSLRSAAAPLLALSADDCSA
jgi:hypothetical protein